MSISFFSFVLPIFFPFYTIEDTGLIFFKETPNIVETKGGIVLYVDDYDYDWKTKNESYKVVTPCGNKDVININNVNAVSDIDVLIDPGHGGGNHGTISNTGILEKNLNLSLAKLLSKELDSREISNLLLRKDDHNQRIWWRAKVAKALSPKLLISLHHNDGPNKKNSPIPGTDVYYQFESTEGQRAASLIYKEVFSLLSNFDSVGNWWSSKKPGVKYILTSEGDDFFGILRNTKGVTSLLLESAYLANPKEAVLLTDEGFKVKHAKAIANGIENFLYTNESGSGFIKQTKGQAKRKRTYLDYFITPCTDPRI